MYLFDIYKYFVILFNKLKKKLFKLFKNILNLAKYLK